MNVTNNSNQLNVFISYSRHDITFAQQLVRTLENRGISAKIDTRDLPVLEDWRRELLGFIRNADVVVFIISSSSIASPVCAWEVEQVAAHNKRLAPIVLERVADDHIPSEISKINYLFFDPPNDFDIQTDKLVKAILTDRAWIKEHTRLTNLAIRWEQSDRPKGHLVRDTEIAAAYEWIVQRPSESPPPPPILLEFLAASRQNEDADHLMQRRVSGRAFIQPAQQALTARRYEHSLRLVGAAAALARDPELSLIPELRPIALSAFAKGRLMTVLHGHEGGIRQAAFSADGTRIVTSSDDAVAYLWDARTGRMLYALVGHVGPINTAVFSPDGLRVVTASDDKTARVWNAITGVTVHVLQGHEGSVQTAVFSTDGMRILTASRDKTARFWHTDTGRTSCVLAGHYGAVYTALFSPDGLRVVTTSDDKTVRIWDATTGETLYALKGHVGAVHTAKFSPDGMRLVTASADGCIALWDLSTGANLAVCRGDFRSAPNVYATANFSPDGASILVINHEGDASVRSSPNLRELWDLGYGHKIRNAAFSLDGARIVTAGDAVTAQLWQRATVEDPVAVYTDHWAPVTSAVFSPDGLRIVTTSEDKKARVWDATTGVMQHGHWRSINCVAFDPGGAHVVTASGDYTARVWGVETGATCQVLYGHSGNVTTAFFNSDGSQVITASEDSTARVWDARTGTVRHVLRGHKESSVDIGIFSPDSTRILTGVLETLRLWNARSGEVIHVFETEHWARHACFSPDSTLIIATQTSSTPRVWNVNTGVVEYNLKGHEDTVATAVFSPDGSKVVTASADKTARIWDARTGNLLRVLEGHEERVTTAIFSPDSLKVVTAGWDNTARLWDVQTGTMIRSLTNFDRWVDAAGFSPDGMRLVTQSDYHVALWDIETGTELYRTRGALTFAAIQQAAAFNPCRNQLGIALDYDYRARLLDLSRVSAFQGDWAVFLAASLALGVGNIIEHERADPLLKDIEEDLFTAIADQIPNRMEAVTNKIAAVTMPMLTY